MARSAREGSTAPRHSPDMLIFLSIALAAQPDLSLGISSRNSGELSANQWKPAFGLDLGAALAFDPVLAVELRAGWWPETGDGGWKPITQQLTSQDDHILQDVSRLAAS